MGEHGTKYDRLSWQLKRPSVGLQNGARLQVYLDESLSNAIQERSLRHHDDAFASNLLKKLGKTKHSVWNPATQQYDTPASSSSSSSSDMDLGLSLPLPEA